MTKPSSARRAMLYASISMAAMVLAAGSAVAQSTDIGPVDVQSNGTGTGGGALPLASPAAVGSKAPAGSAPALAPTQGSLESYQPGSIVSDKVIRDLVPPTGDYNEVVKYTPGYFSSNPNGLLGDTKGGWRGFQDGQYDITFDGIPFGDANDPTHHSAAYFPSAFIGGAVVDRGPGGASQIGYAPFGGTLSLNSYDLSDTFGGNVSGSYGSNTTIQDNYTIQTGKLGNTGIRALFQYSNAYTAGAINYGKYNQNQYLAKIEEKQDNFKLTLFSAYGFENYNNVVAATYPQILAYGKKYGAVNNNPLSQQYVGYNNSQKRTDLEYIALEGSIGNFHVENKVYTYAYDYPALQNNGNNQTIEGNSTTANGGTITTVSIPTITGGKTKVNVLGVVNGNVVGYIKNNNYRAYGDVLKADYTVNAGIFSGKLRAGLWVEQVNNERLQEYINYTTGQTFPSLGNSLQASYKLNLNSTINNFQPFIEYEWTPIERLTITPGYKYESFRRDHDALVNQTTLQPLFYSHTYDTSLPFLAANYKVTPNVNVYAQASQGFLAPSVSAYYVFNPAIGGIKPQTTTNFQAGAVYKSERITADADIYQVRATNFPVVTNLPTGQQIYANGGTAEYRGAEAEGSYSIINGLSAYASGALIGAKYTSGANKGLRVGDAPDYTTAGGAIYDDGRFFGSLIQKFTGGAYGSSGQKQGSATTAASLNYIKPYNTTDLVVGFRTDYLHGLGVGKTAQVKLGIYNVFDHKNTTEISGDPTGLTNINNTSLAYSFLPGRLVYGSVSLGF